MTLTKAIEAAVEMLEKSKDQFQCYTRHLKKEPSGAEYTITNQAMIKAINDTIAILPDKPMTELEITQFIIERREKGHSTLDIVRALKAANVLYVEEK